MRIIRTNSANEDFKKLVVFLDKELSLRDGDDHNFYHQFNGIDTLKNVIVWYENNLPVACGAIKKYDNETMEVKRMFVLLEYRKKGFATLILNGLETWAKELNYKKLILETGINQPEAIALYKKNNYNQISNYGQYEGVENSLCFLKNI